MESPLISIIIPVYNGEKYLRRCLDSIVAQTYTNYECLMIDDGSTDSSGAILDEYAARDNRFIAIHKENGGVSSARNIGLDNMKGEWVTFCDCDDYTFPDWLSNYNAEQNFEFDLICQGFKTDKLLYNYISNNNIKHNSYSCDFEGSPGLYIYKLQESFQFGFLWINLFHFKIIKEHSIKFNEQFNHAEDHEFIFHFLCYCSRTKAINKIGYFYYVPNWNSKYSKDNDFDLEIGSTLYKYVKLIATENGIEEKIRQKYREDLTSKYIDLFIHKKNRRLEAVEKLRDILVDDFWKSQLFFLTKVFLVIDLTYYFSRIILLLHLSLKYKKWI